jgi:hypothetical protein
MNAPASQHYRLHEQLMEYWTSLLKGRPMPFETEVNSEDIASIWDHCFLVRVANDSFAYDYLGASLVEAYGDNFTSREICESLIYPHPEPLFRTFQKVKVSCQPVHDEDEFTNQNGMVVKYRSCVLPLAKHGHEGVAFLLGGMKWKAY